MNLVALKEWAVVCEALRRGRQSVILRKGGIHEGPRGFRPEHDQFLLYPTQFHQSEGQIIQSAQDLLPPVEQSQPAVGRLRISLLARVVQVYHLCDEAQLAALDGLHVLTHEVLRGRFHYRSPGLYVLVVQVFLLPEILELDEQAHYAGCHSWVHIEVDNPLNLDHARMVIPDTSALAILNERLADAT